LSDDSLPDQGPGAIACALVAPLAAALVLLPFRASWSNRNVACCWLWRWRWPRWGTVSGAHCRRAGSLCCGGQAAPRSLSSRGAFARDKGI
jgi:hypothetical protein